MLDLPVGVSRRQGQVLVAHGTEVVVLTVVDVGGVVPPQPRLEPSQCLVRLQPVRHVLTLRLVQEEGAAPHPVVTVQLREPPVSAQ